MRRWLFLVVAVPAFAWLLDRVADQIETRRGEGAVTHAMRVPHARRVARRAR